MARVLIGNIKGPKGDKGDTGKTGPTGPAGPTGQVDSSTPIEFSEAESDVDIKSGESLKVLFGKLLKTIKTLKTGLSEKAASTHKHEISDVTNIGEASVKYAESAGTANNATTASNAGYADSAGSVAWEKVSGKPSSFAPSSHTHDDRYYTETEVDNKLNSKAPLNHSHAYVSNSYRNNRIEASYIDIDIGALQTNACWGFIILCHSWIAGDNGASMYWVSGIQGQSNTAYWDVQALYKSGRGPTVTILNGNHIRITFYNQSGGGYGIIPMVY